MTRPASYLLCGTPRTGSTLLCGLLASTGVAGRPESYFREPDRQHWAERFELPALGDGRSSYSQFVAAAVRCGSTPNGVFAARVMWGTMHRLVEGLDPGGGWVTALQVLTERFGPLRFVHLWREDIVAQAVSWARAEQTGFWQHGDVPSAEPQFDARGIDELVDTIHRHNAAWRSWFADQGVEPVEMTYERLVAEPRHAVDAIVEAIGSQVPAGWTPASPHTKQADPVNAEWLERYHAEHGWTGSP